MTSPESHKKSNNKHYHSKVKNNPELMYIRSQRSLKYYYEKIKPFKEEIYKVKAFKEKPEKVRTFKEEKKEKVKDNEVSINIVNKPIVVFFE